MRAAQGDAISHNNGVAVQFGFYFTHRKILDLKLFNPFQGQPAIQTAFGRNQNVIAGDVPFQFFAFTSFQKLRSRPSPPVASAHLLTACSRHIVQPCSRMVAQTSTNITIQFRMARFYQGLQSTLSSVIRLGTEN